MLELINWLKDGTYRVRTLEALEKQPLLSSEIASKMNINRSSMSRILSSLKEKKLVKSTSGNSRTITYSITELGKTAIKKVRK